MLGMSCVGLGDGLQVAPPHPKYGDLGHLKKPFLFHMEGGMSQLFPLSRERRSGPRSDQILE